MNEWSMKNAIAYSNIILGLNDKQWDTQTTWLGSPSSNPNLLIELLSVQLLQDAR